jgi:hypothetical protein
MATDPLVRSDVPAELSAAEPSEAEYRAFCDTVMTTGRGRWFLAEYARRHRKATTQDALDTLSRIEGRLRGARNTGAAHVFEELRSLAATIHHARLDIGWSDSEFSKGAKVMALLELLEDRIGGLLDDSADDVAPAPEEKAEPRVQLTVIAANPLPPRTRAELPVIDFTGESTVVALQQPAPLAVFAVERTQITQAEIAQVEIAQVEISLAEPPASTLAFPAVALFQPFEVDRSAAVEIAAPVDFEHEPFDAEALAPEVFEAPIAETAVEAATVETVLETVAEEPPANATPVAGDVELFDMPAAVEPAVAAEPVATEEPVAAPPPVAARRQLPPGYDPMTPVRALSADERIALVS